MKDQHGNKITEHEFTKDIGHRAEMTKTIEEMFEEYAGCYKAVDDCLKELTCPMCKEDKERMSEIITEVTKQIQADLLKKIEHNLKSQFKFTRDMSSTDYNRGIEKCVRIIKKLAEEKDLTLK